MAFDQNIDDLPALIADLSTFVVDVPQKHRQWVVYGSRALGTQRDGSDVDVLLLHDGGPGWAAHRRSGRADGRPATIYVLSHDELRADGGDRRFGGYFTLKLFHPFVTDRPENEPALNAATARFLGPFGRLVRGKNSDIHSADQLVARAHLAFLALYPDFAGYVGRTRRDEVLFRRVWRHQRQLHVAALRATGHVVEAGDDRWSYTSSDLLDDPDRERARCTARFWAFGAACHSSSASFPDQYFTKTDGHATRAEQREVVAYLHAVADGRERP